jgi:hypothetical protein
MKPTINKIWFDRRTLSKPRWLCTIRGGIGGNNTSIQVNAVGCCRWIAWRRAKSNWKKESKRGM